MCTITAAMQQKESIMTKKQRDQLLVLLASKVVNSNSKEGEWELPPLVQGAEEILAAIELLDEESINTLLKVL